MTSINSDSAIGLTRSVQGLRARVSTWRETGKRVALIPTMGALHDGHLSLIQIGRDHADKTVASIFVNPRQFGPTEDLATYPRGEAEDLRLLAAAKCDLVFIPTKAEMYPDGYQTSIDVAKISQGLCGASRPQFFGGIATIVCKLLNQCQPDIAVFGEKDFQQLQLIKRMVRDLDLPVEIIGAPILREKDGLAMSSRNRYLTPKERLIAGQMNQILRQACRKITTGTKVQSALTAARTDLVKAGFDMIDYLEIRRASDLYPLGPEALSQTDLETARIFVATMLGKTRLIDNMKVAVT